MKPLKLTMQAFGSYGRKTPPIDFTKPNQNLFLITGDTGAGKTTIFDAIVFAIYGEASSGSNRKDGTELQSQYVDYDTEPFVELTFSEKDGEETRVYTVRRIPRHVRPLRRGSGVKEESGSVCLTMPDGRVYPQKETDKKLEEIVGLTKEQFMQVAMIAQGEFMELLRARSDEKKVIFRKLFHTELFQDIVEELGGRRKDLLSDMAQIRTVCQTEAAHVTVPQDYEGGEALETLRRRILVSDRLSVTDMESFLEELETLCHRLEEGERNARKTYEEAGKLRDAGRDAFTGAQSLLRSFEQLERAERDLAECAGEEEEIKEAARLTEEIHAAYEIKAVYQRFADAEGEAAELERELEEQRKALPELVETYHRAAAEEAEAKKSQEAELASFAKVSERVEKALGILQKIKAAAEEADKKEKAWKAAEASAQQAQKRLVDLEGREREWRIQSEELADADKLLALWEVKREETEGIAAEAASVQKAWADVVSQRKKADRAQQDYAKVRQEFAHKNTEYVEKQTAFLDAQAGFIAREKLREGQPCPVCGSLEHPHPCELSKDHQDLTREGIELLAEELAKIRQEQQDKAGKAGAAADLLIEKQNNLKEKTAGLRERMAKHICDVPEELTPELAQELISAWTRSVDAEGVTLRQNANTLAQVRESLKSVDGQKRQLKEAAELAAQEAADAKTALAGSRTALEGLEAHRDYLTEEEAKAALAAASASKREKDASYAAADQAVKTARQKKENAEALMGRCSRELPGRREESGQRMAAYRRILEEKALTEQKWKEVTEKHLKTETADLQEKVDIHNRRKATAEGIRESARKAVDGRERPVIEELERAKNEAEENLSAAQKAYERYREDHKADSDAYHALAPKMEERRRIMQDYARLDGLYNRLAGKVTGSRMDIETFVQRYYLQRILYAANVRFREMSAGQFEFRMVGEEQAGEGRNRGLDLMIYSAVTGREREVRTLSGGESFMAALSLALGMADQIRESSAAINLDVMFIDEGFGSLDEHSRGQAVRVLQQMAGGSRLIGIISHVTELKQEIEDQLLVSKDEEGSHVKWQIS